jgi:hypothetical protein
LNSASSLSELCELSVWFESIYDSKNVSFNDVWSAVVEAMECASTGSTTYDNMDSYKVALPPGLAVECIDSCITFCTNSSHPRTFEGLSKGTCGELLSSMLNWIFVFFRACASPESYLARATTADNSHPESENCKQRVVLIGARNLKRSTASFTDPSLEYIDKSMAGWTPTPYNIKKLSELIQQQCDDGARAFIFYLLGKTGLMYEQFDGTTSVPFRSGGRYHLGGKAIVCPAELFKRTVDSISRFLGEC